jgi:predicted ATP-dependent serine protease
MKTLYISGEEAPEQVKDRADRLGVSLKNCYFSSDLQVEGIADAAAEWKDKLDKMDDLFIQQRNLTRKG